MLRPVVNLLPRAMELVTPIVVMIPKHRIGFVSWDPESVQPHVKVNGFHINRPTPAEAAALYRDIRIWINSGTALAPSDHTPVDSAED